MTKRLIMAVAATAGLLTASAGWYLGSPQWTLRQMRAAADKGDAKALSAYIDFPAFRADLKSELGAAMTKKIAETGEKNNPFTSFGMAIAMTFVDKMIDTMVTPAGMRAMFSSDAATAEKSLTQVQAGRNDLEVEHVGLSAFRVREAGQGNKAILVFNRDGLGWKLVGIDLPLDPK